MTIRFEFLVTMDNDCFCGPDGTYDPSAAESEVRRLLIKVAGRVDRNGLPDVNVGVVTLLDTNGNMCGTVRVTRT